MQPSKDKMALYLLIMKGVLVVVFALLPVLTQQERLIGLNQKMPRNTKIPLMTWK